MHLAKHFAHLADRLNMSDCANRASVPSNGRGELAPGRSERAGGRNGEANSGRQMAIAGGSGDRVWGMRDGLRRNAIGNHRTSTGRLSNQTF